MPKKMMKAKMSKKGGVKAKVEAEAMKVEADVKAVGADVAAKAKKLKKKL